MAALVIAAAGSAIGGSLITGTVLGLSGASIGYFAGSLLASALIKGPNSQGPRLGDLRVSGTEYGAPIPWVAGGPRIAGQCTAWASDRREIANTQKVGKGGGGKVTNFTYEVDLLILLTENEIEGVSRIWSNGEVVYSGVAKDDVWNSLAVYTGDPTQLPDPTYEAAVGLGNAPAYRGRGYVVIQGLQLGGSGQIPNLTFEVGTSFGSGASGRGLDFSSSTLFFDEAINASIWEQRTAIPDRVKPSIDWTLTERFLRGAGQPNAPLSRQPVQGREVFISAYFSSQRVVASWIEVAGSADFGFADDFEIFFVVRRGELPGIHDPYTQTFGEDFTLLNCSPEPGEPSILGSWRFFVTDRVLYFTLGGLVLDTSVFSADIFPLVGSPYKVAARRTGNTVEILINDVVASSATDDGWLGTTNSTSPVKLGLYSELANYVYNGSNIFYSDLSLSGGASGGSSSGVSPIDDVCAEALRRAGYLAEEFDVSELASITKPVRGMALGQIAATRGVLETLQTAYFFEPSKSDKIYLRPRSTTPVASIPYDDLGAADNAASDAEPLELTVGSELEMPSQISLSYNNTAADYNVSTEHSDRLLSSQVSTQVVQLGLGMLPAEAKGVADGLLVDQLASITRTTLRLPLKYAFIEPGDVFTVTNSDGRVYRLRSTTKTDTLTTIEHQCVLDDAGALTSAAITSEAYTSNTAVRQIASTLWEAMDIPLLRDEDDSAGYYVAMSPNRATPADQWGGAAFLRSWSDDAFEQLVISGDACTMGACSAALPPFAGGEVFDESSLLNVTVSGELSSASRAILQDSPESNVAAIGVDGRWEIVRFKSAVLTGSAGGKNSYTLSGFVRGLRGTQRRIATHAANESFVLLDSRLRRVSDSLAKIGVASQVKGVTLNLPLSGVPAVSFINTGDVLRPFPVYNIRRRPDPAGTVYTWNRQTRYSENWLEGLMPLGESVEAYRVDIFSGSTLKRSLFTSVEYVLYSAADQFLDFGATSPVITVEVVQLGALSGAASNAPDGSSLPPASSAPLVMAVGSDQSLTLITVANSSVVASISRPGAGGFMVHEVYESVDGGSTFASLPGPSVYLSPFSVSNSSGQYVSFPASENGRLGRRPLARYSVPGGISLVRGEAGSIPDYIDFQFPLNRYPVALGSDGSKFMVLTEGEHIYTSSDGITWTDDGVAGGLSISLASPGDNPTYRFQTPLLYSSGRWVVSISGLFFYTTDPAGLTGWTQVSFASGGAYACLGLEKDDAGVLVAYLGLSAGNPSAERIDRSADNGNTWSTVWVKPSHPISFYFPVSFNRFLSGYVAFFPSPSLSYALKSTDNGLTWTLTETNLAVAIGPALVSGGRYIMSSGLDELRLEQSSDAINFTYSGGLPDL